MTWRFFRWGETTSVRELVARHEYAKAIGVLRATLKQQPGDRRLRLDLAEVLVHAGQKPQAIKMLLELADELFRGDFRARARAVLKRIEDLEPGRPDVAERLEVLDQMERANPRRVAWPVSPSPTAAAKAPETHTGDGPLASAPPPAAAASVPTTSVETSEDEIPIDTTALDLEASTATEALEPLGHAFLEGLPSEPAAAFLSKLARVEREPGDVLVTEGEKGKALFLLVRGTASVFVKDKAGHSAKVACLRPGDYFGEVGALTGLRRIATVTAATRCELLVIEKPVLDKLLASHPQLRELLEESLEQRVGDPRANAARGKKIRRHLPGRHKAPKGGSKRAGNGRGARSGTRSSNPSSHDVPDAAKRPGPASRADRLAQAGRVRWRRGFTRSG